MKFYIDNLIFDVLDTKIIPRGKKVSSVCIFAFDKKSGGILTVNLKKKKNREIDIPGGHIEIVDNSLIEALKREVWEEAKATIKDRVMVSSIIKVTVDKKFSGYMVIFTGIIKEFGVFVETEESRGRNIMQINEFLKKYRSNKEFMAYLADRALKDYKKFAEIEEFLL